jgi:hypothetical protein
MNLQRQLEIITARFLPVFWIHEILAQIRILGYVPKKRIRISTKMYGFLTKTVFFLGVWECKVIQK